MRIAQVAGRYHPKIGGVETHVRRLAQGLSAGGDEVTVLTHRVGDLSADETVDSVRILRFSLTVSATHYQFSRELFRYLREHATDFDVVHAHNYHNIVGQAAVRCHLPYVFTPHYHGTGHTALRAMLHHVYRPVGARQFAAAEAVICVSDAERDLVVNDFPEAIPKIQVIPNGIDPRAGIIRQQRATRDERMILTVGRLERYKNVDLIIRAFRALPPNVALVIVGEGSDRLKLEQLAQSAHPGQSIHFTGRVSDEELDELLALADVVVSASDHEAFGLIIADGLAAGARVVASSIPAHREISRLAGSAAPIRLIDPRNTGQFAAALAAALEEGPAIAGSVQLPSWADVVDRTRKLYSSVCATSSFSKWTSNNVCIPDSSSKIDR